MSEPYFTIHDTYFIKGRGFILFSFLDSGANPPVRVRIGDEIELTTEDGGCVKTIVTGVEMVHDCGSPGQFPLGLLVSLVPDDHHALRGAKAHVIR
jgi:translation elongation factor EF-Tu-like GTPase